MSADDDTDDEESTAAASDGPPPRERFDALQDEVEEVGFDGLLDDPEYVEFLEDFGELEMAEDEVAFGDLVDLEPGDDAPGPTTDGGQSAESDRSQVVDDLIDALESEAVTERQRAELRDALGLDGAKRTEIQLNHLKSRFVDLEAYIRAMESLFDDGTVEDLREIRADLDALREEVRGRIESIERGLVALDRRQQALGDDLEAVEASVEDTRDALRRNLPVIERELKRNRALRDRLRSEGGVPSGADSGERTPEGTGKTPPAEDDGDDGDSSPVDEAVTDEPTR